MARLLVKIQRAPTANLLEQYWPELMVCLVEQFLQVQKMDSRLGKVVQLGS